MLETAVVSTPLSVLALGSSRVELRRAAAEDLPALVGLLAADSLGRARENAAGGETLAPYRDAFRAINADPAQLLVVAAAGQDVVGTMQLSFIPGLARRGALRAQIEAGAGTRGLPQSGPRGRDVPVGDRGGAGPRVRPGAADHRQDPRRRPPLL